jgi:predicted outer membrane repeat protein
MVEPFILIVKMDENKLIDCFSNHDGGAIYIHKNNNNVLIRNNILLNCTSVEQGGGIMLSFSNKYLTIENNSFIDCKSNDTGGAIYANYDISYIKIQKNHFISCISLQSGGGIYFNIYNHDVIIHDNNFVKGIVEKAGTAIMINSCNSNFMITECFITNSINRKFNEIPIFDDIGGVFYLGNNNSVITISNCQFYNIKSNSFGAIVIYSENKYIFVKSNQIENVLVTQGNRAGGGFAFVNRNNDHIFFSDNIIMNGISHYAAGILIFESNHDIFIRKNIFINCSAISASAINVAFQNYAIELKSNIFENCSEIFEATIEIYQFNHDISITDSYMKNCNSKEYAGGLSLNNNNFNIVIDNIHFDSCSAIMTDGGSLHIGLNNSNILINNTTFQNSISGNNGGGLFVGGYNVNINITYCKFLNNKANKGGAIFFENDNSNIIIVGTVFHKNIALSDGGACYFQSDINNVLFIDEDSYNSMYLYSNYIPSSVGKNGQEIQVTKFHRALSVAVLSFDSTSSENIRLSIAVDKKIKYSGVLSTNRIYFGISSPPLLLKVVNDTVDISVSNPVLNVFVKFSIFPAFIEVYGRKNIFVDNKVINGDGGAIYFHVNNNFVKILNADFLNNIANNNGGAIYFGALNPGSVLVNVLFKNNYCSQKGGGINFYTYNSGVQLYNVSFISNHAIISGGALYLESMNGIQYYKTSNEISIRFSTFVDNHANSYGGAIYSSQFNIIIITDCIIVSNFAQEGGGIMIMSHSNLSFMGINNLTSNTAFIGGALLFTESYLYTYCSSSTNLSIVYFTSNKAERGSAIYMDSVLLINNKDNTLCNMLFYHNHATVGGTIYWIYDDSSTREHGMKVRPMIRSTQFTNNIAYYGNEIATQAIKFIGPSSYNVTVYNQVLKPPLYFKLIDFYDNKVHGDININPLILIIDNIAQCNGLNPYLSVKNQRDLVSSTGTFVFGNLEIYCYPDNKLEVSFQASSSLSEISNDRSNVININISTLFHFRLCHTGEIIVTGTCDICPAGSYSLINDVQSDTACKDCSKVAGVRSCHSNYIEVESKYWRRYNNSETILSCLPYFDGCNGGFETGDESCRHGYRGILCASCIDGYYSDGVQCIPCNNTSKHFTPIAIFYLCIGGLVMMMLCINLISKNVFKYDLFAFTRESLKRFNSKIFIQLRIVIATYQVVGSIQYSLIAAFPYLFSKFTVIVAAFYFNISALFPLACQYSKYNFIDFMILWATLPMILIFLLFIVCAVEYKRKVKKLKYENDIYEREIIYNEVKNKYLFYFFFLTYLILPSVTTVLFRMFICTNVDPNHENLDDDYDNYLVADVRIPCYTSYWYKGVIYSCLLIVIYPIGIPMMYLWLLSRCKDELKSRRDDDDDDVINSVNEINDTSNTITQFNRERSESIDLIAEMNTNLQNTSENNFNNRNLSSYAECLGTLWEPYKNEYWYWEVIECYRRIILTSILSTINPGSSLQSIIAVMFSLFFIKLYSHYSPYASTNDNVLAEIGQFQVFLTFFMSLIIKNSLLSGNKWKSALGKRYLSITSSIFFLCKLKKYMNTYLHFTYLYKFLPTFYHCIASIVCFDLFYCFP